MKPKMHSSQVDVTIDEHTSWGGRYAWHWGKRRPVEVAAVKMREGTLFFEYIIAKYYSSGEPERYIIINPTATFKTNLYPDTIMEFSLGTTTTPSEDQIAGDRRA